MAQVGKDGEQESAWLKKLERYTAVLYPGDVLINPPWFWHGILNVPNDGNISKVENHPDLVTDLVIGVPTRYQGIQGFVAAVRSNPMLTLTAFGVMAYNKATGLSKGSLEQKINDNRVARMKIENEAK